MSSNHKNNHYHYAEKFSDRNNKRFIRGKKAYMPFKSVIISLVVLVMFGFVSTTFAVYVSDNQPEYDPEAPSIITEVRNIKESRDIALTGADLDLSATGATWSFSGGYLYFEKPSTWTTNASSIQLVIGKGSSGSSSWSECYAMSAITNTNYYVVSLPSSGWGDATYMCVIGNSSAWGGGQWGTSNLTNAANKTSTYTSGIESSSGQLYLFNGNLEYKGTTDDMSVMDVVTLKAHACYTTTGASNSYTADNATGGTVKISSYYFNAYNSITNSDTGTGAASASYNAAKTTSSKYSTFTASAASGYRFVGWFTAANGGSSVSTSATYSYSTNGGNKEVYARFLKQVTVTPAKNPTAYSGTAPTASPSGAADVGTTVTVTANVPTGVSFGGWTFSGTYTFATGYNASSNPCDIKPTTNVTATASYTLTAPTISSFSYSATTEGAATAITPSKSATSAAGSNGSLSYGYTYVSGPSDGSYTLNATSGAFKASVAGKYKIRLTVTDTAYGLTNSNTAEYEITVRPVAPTGIEWEAAGMQSGDGTYAVPYKVPANTNNFNIHSYIPIADRNANYTYNWTRKDGTYVLSSGVITVGSNTKTTSDSVQVTDDTLAATLSGSNPVLHNTVLAQDTQGYIYRVTVKSKRNNVESVAYTYDFYYGVTADFLNVLTFDYSDFNSTDKIQKIYDEDNDIDHIDATYEAGGVNTFNTMLFYSKDHIAYNKVAVWAPQQFTVSNAADALFNGTHSALPNDVSHQVSTLMESISTVARNSVNLMAYSGPKWFKGYVDDYSNPRISYQAPELHTTVGTSSATGDRPIYFYDTTGVTQTDTRLMLFYVTDGETDVQYQTGQAVAGRTDTYRFYVPSDTTYVSFAYVADNNYLLPAYSAGQFSYSGYADVVLKAWTAAVDLSASENSGKTTYNATTAGTPTDGIYNYTGSMTTLN